MSDTVNFIDELFAFLDRLAAHKLQYQIERSRDDAVSVVTRVPGEFWEIEFLTDGSVDVERYRSTGQMMDRESLDELFALAD